MTTVLAIHPQYPFDSTGVVSAHINPIIRENPSSSWVLYHKRREWKWYERLLGKDMKQEYLSKQDCYIRLDDSRMLPSEEGEIPDNEALARRIEEENDFILCGGRFFGCLNVGFVSLLTRKKDEIKIEFPHNAIFDKVYLSSPKTYDLEEIYEEWEHFRKYLIFFGSAKGSFNNPFGWCEDFLRRYKMEPVIDKGEDSTIVHINIKQRIKL